MAATKADILARLQKDIFPLQGLRSRPAGLPPAVDLGLMNQAFPSASFPVGAIHEFVCPKKENTASSSGFIVAILSSLMGKTGAAIWISKSKHIYPPGVLSFGIDPSKIIFVGLQQEKEILWATEEALRCATVAAVIAETKDLPFTASRRLQLAVEQSHVTGFILRCNTGKPGPTACISRWQIDALPSETEDNLPGVGFPRWKVELLKIRNGTPGCWQLEWKNKKFEHVPVPSRVIEEEHRKIG